MRKTALKFGRSRRRETGLSQVVDEKLGSRSRSDVHFTSGRRPPFRRRGCLCSLI